VSWQNQRIPAATQLLPLPDDGIAVSNHPPGWLGLRWRALLDRAPKDCQDRILRGRNYARRGRLRGLEVQPGAATADVFCEQQCRPTLRVRPFSRQEWTHIVRELTADLNLIASLLEGELPQELVARLEKRGIKLLPSLDELSFDCDCGDFVMPCTHCATVFHVLTDALDGEPFLLLTLRGRDRDHLLATLRSDWGDEAPFSSTVAEPEEAPPRGSWEASPGGVPEFPCHFGHPTSAGAGLRALGPPPGEDGLLSTLLPLYEAALVRSCEVVDAVPDRVPGPRRRPRTGPELGLHDAVDEDAPIAAEAGEVAGVIAVQPPPSLTVRVVEALTAEAGATSDQLAAALGLVVADVHAELVDLLDHGLVMRRKEGRLVRWFLG
jgi:hypothetical protein